MNRRKTIYKGFNKRKKGNGIKIIVLTISICLIGGYTYTKIKDIDIINKIGDKVSNLNWDFSFSKFIPNKKENTEYTYDDVKKEVDEIKDDKKESIKENESTEKEEVKEAKINGWSIYTVQVASVEKSDEMKKIETKLNENKIPFSVIEIDGLKKVQTYGSFDKNITRENVESMRKLYPDAFMAELTIPTLSFEYTSKYSYVDNISTQLNKLIESFEKESKFWANSKIDVNLSDYNKILTDRKQILSAIENEANRIDYKEMNVFKENLIKYVKSVDDKIELASKSANEQNYQISKGLFLSGMQEYLEFINSIKDK